MAEIEGNMRVVAVTFVNANPFLFSCVRESMHLRMYTLWNISCVGIRRSIQGDHDLLVLEIKVVGVEKGCR
jgi:hypothetical protein